jgi:hypothetical protein
MVLMTVTDHTRDAHEITRPDGVRVIALSGAAAYDNRPGWTATPVRGHDDPRGRGFVITERKAR